MHRNEIEPHFQALWRFRDQAMELAATILAIARSSKTDREPLYVLHDRQIIQLSTLLHEFSFNVRKAVELSEVVCPGIIKAAKGAKLGSAGTSILPDEGSTAIIITCESFWWIVCRLVHSTFTLVHESLDTEVNSRGRITSTVSPQFFGFRSDYDSVNTTHYIVIEDFLQCFIVCIDPLIVNAYETKPTDTKFPGA